MKNRIWTLAMALLLIPCLVFATDIRDNMNFTGENTHSGTNTFSGATALTGPTTISGAVLRSAELVTATNVLTASECGKIMFLNSATEFITTLPAISTVSAGCEFDFFVKAAPAGAAYTVITGNSLENVLYGGAVERDAASGPYVAAGDTFSFVASTAVQGDHINLISDGSYFYVSGQVNTDGAFSITIAD